MLSERHKTLYNRFIRRSLMGVFDRIFAGLAGEVPKPERIMIDATHLKAHRTAASLLKKGDVPLCIGRTKGGLNSKLHTVCDGDGRPIILLLSEGQMSEHKGARIVLDACRRPPTSSPIAVTTAPGSEPELDARGIEPCIPSSRSQKTPFDHDKALYRQRHKVKNLFAGSRTGDASQPTTTDAPTHSSQPSASQPPSSSGSDQ